MIFILKKIIEQRKRRKILDLLTLGVSLLTLGTGMVSIYAWYGANRTASVMAKTISVKNTNDLIKQICFYPLASKTDASGNEVKENFVYDANEGKYITFTKNDEGNFATQETYTVDFGRYDSLLGYVPSVLCSLKINYTYALEGLNGLYVNARTATAYGKSLVYRNADGTINKLRMKVAKASDGSDVTDSTPSDGTGYAETNAMSSIMSFQVAPSANQITDNKTIDLRGEFGENASAKPETKSFADINATESSVSYNQDLELYAVSAQDIRKLAETYKADYYINIICEYNPEAIEYIYSLNLGNDALAIPDSERLVFDDDWKVEVTS